MSEKTLILFVDDDTNLLSGLKRMLRSKRSEWDMHFAEGGEAGLEIVKKQCFDIVVSDMKMPGMNGATFLTHVQECCPYSTRVILSGQAEEEAILKACNCTHQYLSKPCDPEVLKTRLEKIVETRNMVEQSDAKLALSRNGSVPSDPQVLEQLTDKLSAENVLLDDVSSLITNSEIISSKLLQFVNSSYFGAKVSTKDISEALDVLGPGNLRSLFLETKIFQAFDFDQTPINTAHAIICKELPEEEQKIRSLAEENNCSVDEAAREVFAASYSELEQYLSTLWNI